MSKSDRELQEQILKELKRYNSKKRRFFLAILTGFAGAIGATIIATIAFYYFAQALEAGIESEIINNIVEALKLREIFEETCK